MRAIRWLATAPLAFVGYAVAVLLVVALTSLLKRLCPPELLVSGLCTASWYAAAEVTAFAISTAVGAALFVALPALAAPGHRVRVALVAFAVGSAYAIWFVSQVGLGFAVPFTSAVASGAVTTWCFASKVKSAASQETPSK